MLGEEKPDRHQRITSPLQVTQRKSTSIMYSTVHTVGVEHHVSSFIVRRKYEYLAAVFPILDILVCIRILIRGSMPLTNGSGSGCGSGSSIFIIDLLDTNKKRFFFQKFFCIVLFEGTFTSFLKDKKSKRSHKTV